MRIVGLPGAGGRRRAGAVGDDGAVRDVAAALGDDALAHLDRVYADLPGILARLRDVAGDAGLVGREGEVAFEIPAPPEASVFCAAANYRDHMLAMAAKLGIEPEPDPRTLGVEPYHFLKAGRQCLIPDGAEVALPGHARSFDWEVELAAIIGRPARDVAVADALSHVAGYAVANDLSARDRSLMKRANVPDGSLFRTDFIGMKAWDRSCPIGPWVVPADAVGDVQALAIGLSVNGRVRQDGSNRGHGLRRGRAGGAPVVPPDADARRRDPDRHAGRHRRRDGRLPGRGRRHRVHDRADRHAAHDDRRGAGLRNRRRAATASAPLPRHPRARPEDLPTTRSPGRARG